jgi:hypothetical protein
MNTESTSPGGSPELATVRARREWHFPARPLFALDNFCFDFKRQFLPEEYPAQTLAAMPPIQESEV